MLKGVVIALVDGLIDNDERVASSKENIPNSILECKPNTLYGTKMAKIVCLFPTKPAKERTLLGPHMVT